MSKKIIGGATVFLAAAYIVYSALTGDHPPSLYEVYPAVALIIGGGEFGRSCERESKLAQRVAEE